MLQQGWTLSHKSLCYILFEIFSYFNKLFALKTTESIFVGQFGCLRAQQRTTKNWNVSKNPKTNGTTFHRICYYIFTRRSTVFDIKTCMQRTNVPNYRHKLYARNTFFIKLCLLSFLETITRWNSLDNQIIANNSPQNSVTRSMHINSHANHKIAFAYYFSSRDLNAQSEPHRLKWIYWPEYRCSFGNVTDNIPFW